MNEQDKKEWFKRNRMVRKKIKQSGRSSLTKEEREVEHKIREIMRESEK